MVVVPKSGKKVRICVDPTRLNKYVKRDRKILPSVDQLLAQIGGAKLSSKLDANLGFWQIKLDPESSKLTTFITPYSRRTTEVLRGIEGVMGLMDNILLHGRSEKEHHQHLIAVPDRLRTEAKDQNGVSSNKEKIRATEEIRRPTNMTEIRRFLVMINQFSKFSPHLSKRLKLNRELLAKKNQWHCGPEQEQA
uniref:Reverse transcriptase domain-containing protein n=1 Tax=Amphimedon queenslandica TaxID=400682 RepID=A0A1X7UFA2_AMPQE